MIACLTSGVHGMQHRLCCVQMLDDVVYAIVEQGSI
jgi:hypothetical protein